jgi:LuxR family maltose regulon positive regulatory protein
MASPLLETKLYVPRPRRVLVPRPRLRECLDRGTEASLTLVCAPAGFGKTTLLAAWVTATRSDGRSAAWLSLDRGDNQPTSFWTYVIAALQTTVPGVGTEPLALLQSPQPPAIDVVLATLLNELNAIPHDVVVVLDDYHVIDARDIQDGIAFLLDHLPEHVHLVIAGRADPPLPLARLRARGELTEIRAADLRFTPDEATAFLNQAMGLDLSAADVAALESRTEGWIAGLQLAALSLQGRDDASGFVAGFAGDDRYIVDYLVEEVLQRQPEHLRSFLLHTALLDRVSGPLCDSVTGRDDSQTVLEALERDNLFVVALDDKRRWYRYHHLFADVLRVRMLADHPDQVPALRRRASQWYERHGMPADAIRHALAADDFERAALLIETSVPAIRRERRDATLLGWLDGVPDDVVRRRPVLSAFYAWRMLVAGDLEAVEPWLRNAEQGLATTAHLPTEGEELRRLPMTIAIYRAALAQGQGDLAATVEHAQHALDLAGPDDHLARAGAAGYLGLASYAQGDLETAVRIFPETLTSLHAAGDTATELSSTVVLADMWIARGQLVEARRLYERALRTVTDQGTRITAATGDLHVGFSELLRELGDLDAARHHLQVSSELGEGASLPENRYRWFVATALVRQAEGDLEGAAALLDQAERLYRRGFLPEVRPIAAVRARIRIAQGDLSAAADWARERSLAVTDELSYLHQFEHLTLVRLLLAQHRVDRDPQAIDDALFLLTRLHEAAGPAGSVDDILVLQALAHEAQGDRTQALAALERVLLATEPEGHVRLFLDEGGPMEALLRAADLPRVAPSRVTLLLAAARDAAASPQHALLDPLSDRELEVLRLLDTPMSVPEIARELFVSPNTLRTHTRHIFTKLEVNNRRTAVHRAAELGLL